MSKKRELLIKTALDLFYKNGINSVGINEILKVSGVAKKTLYNHFESKDTLVLSVLKQRHEIFIHWLEEQLSNAKSDHDVITQLFTSLGSWFNSKEPKLGDFRGCFFINTAAEFSNTDSDIFRYCSEHKERVKLLIEDKLNDSSAELLDAICIMKEGAINSAYMTAQPTLITAKCIKILVKLSQ